MTSKASRPPRGASITFARIRTAHLSERNIVYKIMKISMMVNGTIISRRSAARFSLSYSPSQSMRYPRGSLTCAFTLLIDSSTALPKSRPRTLYFTAMYRWFPSR